MSQKKRTKFVKLEDISPPVPKKEDSWEELRDAALKERFSIRARTPNQLKLMNSILTNVITFVSAPAGTGKAQPLDSLIYTPSGPKTMGEIQIGDIVCTPDNGSSKVLATFPQGLKDIYKITFNNGDTVECCKEHLWMIDNKIAEFKNRIVDTDYLINNIRTKDGRRKIIINNPKSIHFNEQTINLDPYLLGVLIGDGCLVGNINITNNDPELIQEITNIVGSDNIKPIKNNDLSYKIYGISKEIKNLGLSGHRSWEKFIPKKYIYNSLENRLAIIQGLMDTDGTVDKKTGNPVYYTTSEQLALDFKELIESIGGLCSLSKKDNTTYEYKGIKKNGRPVYICYIKLNETKKLFRLARKRDLARNRTKYKSKRIIEKIEFIGQKEAKCILIDSKEHMYVTNHCIPTHNTFISCGLAAKLLLENKIERIIITRPQVEVGGKGKGFLPGNEIEKMLPYIVPMLDALEVFLGKKLLDKFIKDKIILISPLGLIRGSSYKNAMIICDEFQDITYLEAKTLLTRIDIGSRMVLAYDKEQCDLGPNHKDYQKIVDNLGDLRDEIGFIKMDISDCQRAGIVKKIIERL